MPMNDVTNAAMIKLGQGMSRSGARIRALEAQAKKAKELAAEIDADRKTYDSQSWEAVACHREEDFDRLFAMIKALPEIKEPVDDDDD